MEKEILLQFGRRIRQLRKNDNLSQEQLAEITGLHRNYIGMVERGERNLTLQTVERLAQDLGVTAIELMTLP